MRAGVWYHLKLIKLPIQKENEQHDGRLRRDGSWQHAFRPMSYSPLVIDAQYIVPQKKFSVSIKFVVHDLFQSGLAFSWVLRCLNFCVFLLDDAKYNVNFIISYGSRAQNLYGTSTHTMKIKDQGNEGYLTYSCASYVCQ